MQPDEGQLIHISLIGSAGVGKSSICKRYIFDSYSEGKSQEIERGYRHLKLCDRSIRLFVNDMCNPNQLYSSKTYANTSYYRVDGIVLVYDITAVSTFQDLEDWINIVMDLGGPKKNFVVLGNKCDQNASSERLPSQKQKNFAIKKILLFSKHLQRIALPSKVLLVV